MLTLTFQITLEGLFCLSHASQSSFVVLRVPDHSFED